MTSAKRLYYLDNLYKLRDALFSEKGHGEQTFHAALYINEAIERLRTLECDNTTEARDE